jgi:hypothetical protein
LDRQIIYPGQIPLETDLLNAERMALIGLGYALQDLIGTGTVFAGLPCTPTGPATLACLVGPGRVYSQQQVDATAFSSLPADTTHNIVKQGILYDSVTLPCPAPSTAGFSVNYLIEAIFQEVDSTSIVLPYYNASNPSSAYSGPNGLGASQNTQRLGKCVVAVKAGIAATTGTQITPTPDAGYTGLYVVTVANGQANVGSGSISTLATAPLFSNGGLSGQCTLALTGCTTAPSGIFSYSVNNGLVSLQQQSGSLFNATSNSNLCTITGIPAILNPVNASRSTGVFPAYNNGVAEFWASTVEVSAGIANINFSRISGGTWGSSSFTASGQKGLACFPLFQFRQS